MNCFEPSSPPLDSCAPSKKVNILPFRAPLTPVPAAMPPGQRLLLAEYFPRGYFASLGEDMFRNVLHRLPRRSSTNRSSGLGVPSASSNSWMQQPRPLPAPAELLSNQENFVPHPPAASKLQSKTP